MRTQQEIDELAYLAQEAISLGATKYPRARSLAGQSRTSRWLSDIEEPSPYELVEVLYEHEHTGFANYERGILTSLQSYGHCIPTYKTGVDPEYLAYLQEQE